MIFCCTITYSQSTSSQTYTAPSSVSVDGCGTYCTGFLPAVTFTTADFPAGSTITDVDVEITWIKVDGTCDSGEDGNPVNAETNFAVCDPSATQVVLAIPATWSGGTTTPDAAVTTTFDQQAAAIPSGLPSSGTFLPNGGSLNTFNGVDPLGNWTLKPGDDGSLDELCIASYTVTITVAPLPVELVYFTASKEKNAILLNWETASEQNNKGFEIQRSEDARNWSEIGFESGAGTTSTAQQYSYLDSQPLSGANYYRLKQLDNDGRFEFSPVVQVSFKKANESIIKVYPNPSIGPFTVDVYNPDNLAAQIQLFDLTGRKVWENNFAPGELPEIWNKEFDLPQGAIYILTVQVGDQVETKKITVLN